MKLLIDQAKPDSVDLSRDSKADERLKKLEEKHNNLLRRFELHLSLLEEKMIFRSDAKKNLTVETPSSYLECEKCGEMYDPMRNFKMLKPGADRKQYIVTFCSYCNHRHIVELPTRSNEIRKRTAAKRIFLAIFICLVGECLVFLLFTKKGDGSGSVYQSGIFSIPTDGNSKVRHSKLKQLDRSMDSIWNIKTRKYEAKLDSIGKVKQIEILDKAMEAQNNRNTVYSLIVGMLAVAAALLFGMKINSIRHRRRYKQLEEKMKEIDAKHKAAENDLKSTVMRLENEMANLNSRDITFDKRLMHLSMTNNKKEEDLKKTNKKRKQK